MYRWCGPLPAAKPANGACPLARSSLTTAATELLAHRLVHFSLTRRPCRHPRHAFAEFAVATSAAELAGALARNSAQGCRFVEGPLRRQWFSLASSPTFIRHLKDQPR